MARKRMFDMEIVDTDLFLDMPQSTQNLYFHLGMRADDDGFVSNPKKVIKIIGANDDDLKLLLVKRFVLSFETGVIVIRHWKINNYLRKDRYIETLYKDEKRQLTTDENGIYEFGIPNVNQLSPSGIHSIEENSIEKNRIIEVSIEENIEQPEAKPRTRFKKPTLEEVQAYCLERNNNVDAERFIDYYEANGWKVGKNSMKDWKATVRTWEKNKFSSSKKSDGWDYINDEVDKMRNDLF